MSSTAAPEAEWKHTVAELSFDTGCDVLVDMHHVETQMRCMQLDVVAQLVAIDSERDVRARLSLQLGLTNCEARERVRIAVALAELPNVRKAFLDGSIDWARLALVTQIAETPEDDAHFASEAPSCSLNQLKVMMARKKAGDVEANERAHKERFARFRHDDASQRTKIDWSIPIDLGLEVEKLARARADSYGRDLDTELYPQPGQALADALCDLVMGEANVTAELLIDVEVGAHVGDGSADLEGHAISRQTLQRMSCDASARPSFVDPDGLPLALGRKTRLFPPWLSRQIGHRDRGCRFPGCERMQWLHDHHLNEWEADVGPTDYANGVKLCAPHHRYVHEGGWKIDGNPEGELQFIRPDGKVFIGRAPGANTDVQAQLFTKVTAAASARVETERDLLAERELERIEDLARIEERNLEKQRIRAEVERARPQAHVIYGSWADPAA